MNPWQTLATARTRDGATLELRKRGQRDFLLVIDGRVLMTSVTRRSEEELAKKAIAALAAVKAPRVLIGGLGMGFTLRAALDASETCKVTVAELDPNVVEWCRTYLGELTGSAVDDRRATVEVTDVAKLIQRAPRGAYDAIILDLYEGPNAATQKHDDPFYGPAALMRTDLALAPNGVFAVWSEDADPAFKKRLETRFEVETHRIGDGGRRHIVYLATKVTRVVGR